MTEKPSLPFPIPLLKADTNLPVKDTYEQTFLLNPLPDLTDGQLKLDALTLSPENARDAFRHAGSLEGKPVEFKDQKAVTWLQNQGFNTAGNITVLSDAGLKTEVIKATKIKLLSCEDGDGITSYHTCQVPTRGQEYFTYRMVTVQDDAGREQTLNASYLNLAEPGLG